MTTPAYPCHGFHRDGLLLVLLVLLCACNQTNYVPPQILPKASGSDIELIVTKQIPAEAQLLEIVIEAFAVADSDAPIQGADQPGLEDSVYQQIHLKETQFLPYLLRNTLIESNQWGAVRVLPDQDPSVDITLIGTILDSDGLNLELQIQAKDSTGREWLNKTYVDSASVRDYPNSVLAVDTEYSSTPGQAQLTNTAEEPEPFTDIYHQIANDLLTMRQTLTESELVNIKRVSEMVYAKDLSPQSFEDYLSTDDKGYLQVNNLAAENDPMLERVAEMRARHFVYIDSVDEHYGKLFDEMEQVYRQWRQYSWEEMTERSQPGASSTLSPDSFLSLSQSYDRYKWSKIYQQEFAELAAGFNQELEPALFEMNRRVHRLSGTLEQQYSQWRDILRTIFELDTGTVN